MVSDDKCQECGEVFTNSDAMRGDWRDVVETRGIICPECMDEYDECVKCTRVSKDYPGNTRRDGDFVCGKCA